MKFILTFIFFISGFYTFSQTDPSIEQSVKKLMENIRTGKTEAVNQNIYKPAHAKQVLKLLENYYADSTFKIRAEAYRISSLIAQKSTDNQERERVVLHLIQACKDPEGAVNSVSSRTLQQFKLKDFNVEARKELLNLLSINTRNLPQIIRLAGFVGSSDYNSFENKLLNLMLEPQLSKSLHWTIYLALARMGKKDAIDYVMNKIKSIQLNDEAVHEIGSTLAYIRQKQSIDYLFGIIQSDEKNCESANPDSDVKILCAYRAMEYVSPLVKNFPLKQDVTGDLDTKDYVAALNVSRAWIKTNASSYQINKDFF